MLPVPGLKRKLNIIDIQLNAAQGNARSCPEDYFYFFTIFIM